MKLERVILRLHVKPEEKEQYEDYKRIFFSLLGIDIDELLIKKKVKIEQLKKLQDTKLDFSETTAISFEERKIIVLEGTLKKQKLTELMLKKIVEKLNDEDRKILYLTADTRIDEDNRLYIRLDKEALKENNYILTDTGDCFRMSFQITTYPKNRETAIKDFLEFVE
jgi:RNA binding exosome subunit